MYDGSVFGLLVGGTLGDSDVDSGHDTHEEDVMMIP